MIPLYIQVPLNILSFFCGVTSCRIERVFSNKALKRVFFYTVELISDVSFSGKTINDRMHILLWIPLPIFQFSVTATDSNVRIILALKASMFKY